MIQKKTYIIGFLLALFGISSLIQVASAAINERGVLNPGEYTIDFFILTNRTTLEREELINNKLIYLDSGEWIDFKAEGPLSLYLVNETEMASFITVGNFVAKYSEVNTTSVKKQVSFENLKSDYGFEPYLKEDLLDDKGEKNQDLEIIKVYIIIINEATEPYKYILRYDYTNYYTDFADQFFAHLIFICFFAVGLKMVHDGIKAKEINVYEAYMMKGYGFGFVLGGLATCAWKFYDYYLETNPAEEWEKVFILDIGSEVFGSNLLSFVTFFCLGFSILFISLTVERTVQKKPIPYYTYSLIVAETLFIVAMAVPTIALYIIYVWIAILVVAGINCVFTYVKLILSTTGILRKKALWVFLGIFLTFATLALRNFVLPNTPINVLAIVFIFVSYHGVKMKTL
jgi:hypothetical protein